MGPKPAESTADHDLFRTELVNLIDQRHELVRLAALIDWQAFADEWSPQFVSTTGRPALPTRLMASLLYLKHVYALSDEDTVERWSENPYWQHFAGMAYFEPRLPCDATTLVKFRRLLGEEGVEELLAQTVNLAVSLKLISAAALATVVVDSTVQEKAVAHPTDSKLLETARAKLVDAAQGAGIELKQTFAKEGRLLRFKAGRYAHAKQFKRMRRVIKRQSTVLGRLVREIERKASGLSTAVRQALGGALAKAQRIADQSRSRKNTSGASKLYAWHAPEVECIAKGKSRTPYEFGVKVGIAATLKHNLIVGARAFVGNPYDGHTLNAQLEQATILMQDTGCKPATAYVDLGYRGVDADNPGIAIKHRGKFKTLTPQERKLLKRRQAIEPIIGHLKSDHRMDRCHLKGEQGDRLHAVLCAAGYNLRWLLRMIAKKGVPFLRLLYLRLCRAAALSPNWSRILRKLAVHAFRQPAPRLAAH